MMMDLKPCPFCNSTRIALLPPERANDPWYVICDQHETCPAPSNWYASREAAAEAWNTRPREDALQAEVEALKGLLEDALICRIGLVQVSALKKNGWAWPDDLHKPVSILSEKIRAALKGAPHE